MFKLIKVILLLTFFTTIFIIDYLIEEEKSTKINSYLLNIENQAILQYKALYNRYKIISTIIYKSQINTPEVIEIFKKARYSTNKQKIKVRQELYSHLNNNYKILKEYNLKQLHFHLPNNDSFLRFHKPQKFGDNLTKIRETVKYVNREKKPIDGFEEGRIYNGYRFVFPMFDHNRHIGSVEISFSTLAMSMEANKAYKNNVYFLLSKDIVDQKLFKSEKSNYVKTEFPDFYEEKSISTTRDIKATFSSKTINLISKRRTHQLQTFFDTSLNKIITMIPITNPITHKEVGLYLTTNDNGQYIRNKNNNSMISLIVSVALDFFIIYFIYQLILKKEQDAIYKEKLEVAVAEKTKELNLLTKSLEQQVELRTKELTYANNQITKSIEFASLIQKAFIYEDESISHFYEEYFVILEQRDVVGGDIVLFEKINDDESLFFIIDCTSHGIPGAFVSMIVKTLQRQIMIDIYNNELTISPSIILSKFNIAIKELLNQTHKDSISNVGFDGVILYFNKKKNQIKFSSARNDVFIVTNNNLERLRGNKHSVGYRDSDLNYKFEEHTLNISEDTYLYLGSDGFVDQRGGDKRKLPFGNKRFMNMIKNNFYTTMPKQKDVFLDILQKYRDNTDRNDDISLIGLKINKEN